MLKEQNTNHFTWILLKSKANIENDNGRKNTQQIESRDITGKCMTPKRYIAVTLTHWLQQHREFLPVRFQFSFRFRWMVY